jgi:cell shape-determining protein MreD
MTRIILRALNGPILVIFIIVAVAVQSSLFSSWPLLYLQPDFVLLAVVWCAFRRNFGEGGVITLIIANISEIHSAAPQGLYLISYMVVYLMMRTASRFFVIPTLFSYAILTLLSSVIWKLVGLLVLYLLGASANQWRHTFTFLLIGSAIEAIISVWVYRWLEKFDWITFKHARAEHAVEEELQLDSEGF